MGVASSFPDFSIIRKSDTGDAEEVDLRIDVTIRMFSESNFEAPPDRFVEGAHPHFFELVRDIHLIHVPSSRCHDPILVPSP